MIVKQYSRQIPKRRKKKSVILVTIIEKLILHSKFNTSLITIGASV